MAQKPRFPLYIVSKGRHDSRLTAKALEAMGVSYFIVVEAGEAPLYSAAINHKFGTVLILDPWFQDEYDTFDDLGYEKSKGPGAARNFAWEHSLGLGAQWHWVMDDNINGFERLNKNLKIKVTDGTLFKCMEDFVLRYENVGMAGPNYNFFAKRKQKIPPFITNTRIYSCNLIRNDLPLRWRGRYNEDTDLSLRMLKSGWCTIQFNAFLQKKVKTQLLKGGNTDAFYSKEGTKPKSEMQVKMHPDCSRLVFKFGRWHHHVDYKRFAALKLIRKRSYRSDPEPNEYGMQLIQRNT